jgi:hypothetical protein
MTISDAVSTEPTLIAGKLSIDSPRPRSGSARGYAGPGAAIVVAMAAARMTLIAPDPAAVDPPEVARAELVEALAHMVGSPHDPSKIVR